MNKIKSSVKAAVLAMAVGLGGLPVHATVINPAGPGNVLNFSWSNPLLNGVTISGTGSMTASIVSGNLQLAVSLTNNTNLLNPGDNTALMSFGFGISPNATSVSLATPVDNGVSGTGGDLNGAGMVTQQGNTNIPSLQNMEVCAFAVFNGNCSGGSVNEGIQAGQSDQFGLTLGGTWGSTVDIAPIGFKFQGTYGSYEFYSSTSSSTSSSSTSSTGNSQGSGVTPEPNSTSLALLALGLGIIGTGLKRRRLGN